MAPAVAHAAPNTTAAPVDSGASEPAAVVSAPVPADSAGADEEAEASYVRPTSGFEYALRFGMSLPFGETEGGQELADEVSYRVPIWLDIGYRFSHAFYFALYAQAGLMGTKQPRCDEQSGKLETACSAEDVRVGVETLFNPLAPDALDLWFGVGVAWQRMRQTAQFLIEGTDEDNETTIEAAGIEEINKGISFDLQAGIDFPVHGAFAVGPFVGYSGGVFLNRSLECRLADCGSDGISQKALHHWAAVGVRGTLGP